MKKYKVSLNRLLVLRILLACSTSIVIMGALAYFTRSFLDDQFARTEDLIYLYIFRFLEIFQLVFYVIAIVFTLLIFSSWIVRPLVEEMAKVVRTYIDIENDLPEIDLPKSMQPLQEELEHINKDIMLWKQAAKEAERKKDELVVYLAHDIRTPLSSTLGYLSLLEDCAYLSDQQQERFVQVALKKAQTIQSLVDELFEITRYNLSQIELHKEKVDIFLLLQQLIEELQPDMNEKKIHLQFTQVGTSYAFIDAKNIARAFENIIVNAIRYSPRNETISIALEEKNNVLFATFQNSGVEVDTTELDRLFEKFYRSDSARQTSTGGSGLGLAIAKNIIEAHKGSIHASTKDKTILFTIQLPIQ